MTIYNESETIAEENRPEEQSEDISSDASDWPEPETLSEELPEVPAFDAGLLPSSLRPMVEDVADRMQVSLDFPSIVAVETLAGLCGRRALIQPKALDNSWRVVPNLWGAIVAPPGMLKSPVITNVTMPARALEAEWRAEYDEALRRHEVDAKRKRLDDDVWAQQYKRAKKNGQPLPELPSALGLTPPVERRLLAGDATFEKLHELMEQNPAGIYVIRDELTGWLASMERQGREAERAFYLESWNGDSGFTVDRIGRGSVHVEHCCASVFGGIQPARLRSYLADALQDGPSNDGLIQRFQLIVWPDQPKNWFYRDCPPDAAALRKAEETYRRIAEMGSANPLHLRFSKDAQLLFIAWLTDLETRLRDEELSPYLQAHLAKYRSLMPALALLFSLADGCLEAVGLEHAQQAADYCEYLMRHAYRIYASWVNPGASAARILARKLQKGWKRSEGRFTAREIYRSGWAGLSTPDEIAAALRHLQDAGWIRRENSTPRKGRPSEVYTINPRIGGGNAAD
jgi:putative DNA primase/helicase